MASGGWTPLKVVNFDHLDHCYCAIAVCVYLFVEPDFIAPDDFDS